ncbi:hypothetical protein CEUSTIGMA_g6602.t1 [Chlamydomonas eustigma]|uniref:Nephrocystin 3-like N-terminal domain-containing protein n=1 Tax=Chlamydomonas eustigma TaxID=1157962 RepID=A0A250X8E6_9CHLO|nr:hypothetical protein CEUSTIGMA_g6602.t1 [Chlamydomonas eustigma]|eukprot:GAX79162.1 hypothetical protein CEUSTIGMA_g6602.t1 [Chlamydomonas eustigma]
MTDLISSADIGRPMHFISHAWQSTVCKLFDTIESFLIDAADSTCVWLDFVAINQNENFAQSKKDVSAFEDCLKECRVATQIFQRKDLVGSGKHDDLEEDEDPIPVCAVHFVKFSDQRRLEAVSILKSLAYQLAVRLDAAAEAILSLSLRTVAEIKSPDYEAFVKLLLPALAEVKQPVVIILDAIEADPPNDQRPEFDSIQATVKTCGDPVLSLLLRFLIRLPLNVRVILTTRPEACCGGIKAALFRAFAANGVTFLGPRDVQMISPTDATESPTVLAPRLLVYDAVNRERLSSEGVSQLPLTARNRGPDLQDLHALYLHIFRCQPLRNVVLTLLLPLLMAAQEPLSTSELQSLSSNPFAVDVLEGHLVLGVHLFNKDAYRASDTLMPSPYTLKHAAHHLCQGARQQQELLDSLLSQWHYLHAVIHSGHGGRLLTAVGEAQARGWLSKYGEDAYRWLSRLIRGSQDASLDWTWVPKLQLGGNGNSWSLDILTLEGHYHSLQSVSFSPDGKQLASCSRDMTVKVWDVNSGTCIATLLDHSDGVTQVCFSPGGRLLASCSTDKTAKIWDLASGTCTSTLNGHDGPVTSLCFNAEGTMLATGSVDKTVKMWDWVLGTCISTLCHKDAVGSVCFSPNGRHIASGCDDNIALVWDLATGASTCTLEGHTDAVKSVCFSPDGMQLASGSVYGIAKVWDLATKTCISNLEGLEGLMGPDDDIGRCFSVVFSPDGKQLGTGCWNATAKVWDIASSGACICILQGHNGPVNSVCFSPDDKQLATVDCSTTLQSPDGNKLASGSDDRSVKIWGLSSGTCISTTLGDHNRQVKSVCFKPDGQHVAIGCCEKDAKVWSVVEEAYTSILSQGHTAEIYRACFSPDGLQLATGGFDKTAKVWDLASRTCLFTLQQGHNIFISGLSFSPDGKQLATGSKDKSAKLWDVATGACLCTLLGHKGDVLTPNLGSWQWDLYLHSAGS